MNGDREVNNGFCTLCGEHEDFDFQHHKTTAHHRFNYLLKSYNSRRKDVCSDRSGITVDSSLVDVNNNIAVELNRKRGKFTVKVQPHIFEQLDKKIKVNITIKNLSKEPRYIIPTILHPHGAFFLDSQPVYLLQQGESCSATIIFRLDVNIVGSFKIPVAITVQPKDKTEEHKYFTIYRETVIYIKDEGPVEEDNKNSPFQKEQWNKLDTHYGPTDSPRTQNEYPIPEESMRVYLYALAAHNSLTVNEMRILTEIRQCLSIGLTEQNYAQFFHNLLWLDEAGAKLGLLQYNMTNVTMTVLRSKTLELVVPGLAEKRPSVIIGDLVNIRVHADHTAYQGVIDSVNDNSVFIKNVHEELLCYIMHYPDIELDVNFELSRLQYERMHKGIEMCISNLMLQSLFPRAPPNRPQYRINLGTRDLINQTIMGNLEQLTAVRNILNHTSQKAPYIVFGPPGTGKTVTIVEAILQLKKNYGNTNILVCAPSNAACDMLAMKLGESCTEKELLRIHSTTRDWTQIPTIIKRFSNIDGDIYRELKGPDLKQYRIVVSTLHLIGKFTGTYSPHFLFIDEAAQATEPECDIPIGLLAPNKLIVLAGDPKQLGPVCSSKVAISYNLDVSLMERLMNTNELYQSLQSNAQQYNTHYLTMLVLNYRSHPDIIKIPNQLFYNDSLQCNYHDHPISKIFVSNRVFGNRNNKKQTPSSVEFCGVVSKEERKGSSPSYFNESEIQMVMKYVSTLLGIRDFTVSETDIGIIAPYIRQVHRIKQRLIQNGNADVEVGTTESFQGREKRIMIISTVRSQHSFLRYDRKYNLGFVKHERRFNVALTRAQSKLIIIGNPYCLGYDKNCWLRYIEYCQDSNAYFGVVYLPRNEVMRNEILKRIDGSLLGPTQPET